MKLQREAYTIGYADGQKGNWRIETLYPRPVQTLNRKVTLSDGSTITGDPTPGWKPSFGKALTPEDADKIVDLWRRPTEDKPVEDAT